MVELVQHFLALLLHSLHLVSNKLRHLMIENGIILSPLIAFALEFPKSKSDLTGYQSEPLSDRRINTLPQVRGNLSETLCNTSLKLSYDSIHSSFDCLYYQVMRRCS
jgi:hypothetical protein